METYLFLFIATIFTYGIYRNWRASALKDVKDGHAYFFDGHQFSTQEFYTLVEDAIKKREIPEVSLSRISLSIGKFFTYQRDYLRVSRHNSHTYDICAAPFGNGFFVSWRAGEKQDWMTFIPIIGKLSLIKTYYQLDTESMYNLAIKTAVDEAMQAINTTPKGMRSLAEAGNALTSANDNN